MNSSTLSKHDFPMQFSLGDQSRHGLSSSRSRTVIVRPLAGADRGPLINFAAALPEEDLLFLERDISQPGEVDAWIRHTLSERLVTLVAWEDDQVVGYATFNRASAHWMRHVAELRVVVAQSARGIGIGRLLLELAFEMVLDLGVTKVIARMTPDQTSALKLFKQLGFSEEAVLRDHALDANGITHDLQVLSFHTRAHEEQCCADCGLAVLDALALDGSRLCSSCYEARYSELGGG
jgi:L-amino acid N-acyltransferase YncA